MKVEYSDRSRVSRKTVDAVVQALTETPYPLTVKELQAATGKSYNTVRAALEAVGATAMGEYPERYYAGEELIKPAADTTALKSFNGVKLIVPRVFDTTDFANRWNRGREVFGNRLIELVVRPDADVRALIGTFVSGASTLATMADLLEQVADKPDWYELVTGEQDGQA